MKRFVISQAEAGQTLSAVVRGRLSLSWSAAQRLVKEQRVQLGKQVCADIAQRVRAGQTLAVLEAPVATRPLKGARIRSQPASSANQRQVEKPRPSQAAMQPLLSGARPLIHYADQDIVVVEKPTGLTTMRHPEEAEEFGHRAGRFLPPTLANVLPRLLQEEEGGTAPPRVLAVHRLDKDTSGLVMFARTPAAAQHLGKQLREHSIERRYLALVRGRPVDQRLESHLVRDRGDGRRGSTDKAGIGEKAVTHVRVVEPLGEFTLVECRLETGRTHQVRIHLGEAGTPLCGERVYDRPLHGKPLADGSGAPRMALHAAVLGVVHPATGQHLRWTCPLPRDLAELLERLRAAAQLDNRH